MKPAAFDYERPTDIALAVHLLAASEGTGKVIAGGQSLGPMLNLRLAQPALLVDVRALERLRDIKLTDDALLLGACTTHAAIEDGLVPDVTRGLMRRVASDIAYRAVRNRGTIGGSLCHADPAADWVSAMMLLSATVIVDGAHGAREIEAADFIVSAFTTALADDEVLTAIRIPRLSDGARWGYYKFCRKPGEFAEALAAILVDPGRDLCRAVIGATHGKPHVIADARAIADDRSVNEAVEAAGVGDDPYERQLHCAALKRAIAQLSA
ncbi:MAG TPA: FAD binding domain-containing protein [Burkholderiales bacterium]|nr:FAD binding domain-containing protein [Burkholderiales bacterium]